MNQHLFFGIFAAGISVAIPVSAQQASTVDHCVSNASGGRLQHIREKGAADDVLCSKGKLVQIDDFQLGTRCQPDAVGKMTCVPVPRNAGVAEDLDVEYCTASSLPSISMPDIKRPEDVLDALKGLTNAKTLVTIWTTKSGCAPLMPQGVAHRVITISVKQRTLCYQPGDACINLSQLENEVLLIELPKMGLGSILGDIMKEPKPELPKQDG